MIDYRSTGHKLNDAAESARAKYAHHVLVHPGDTRDPAAASVRVPTIAILDQGQTSACTGHACARAVQTAMALAGTPLPFDVSPMGIYTPARCFERAAFIVNALNEPLGDDGAEATTCMRAVSIIGVCAIGTQTPMASDGRWSDADPATVNREPDFRALLAGAKHVLVGEFAISTVAEARHALSNRTPVTIAIYADRAVNAYRKGSAPLGAGDRTDKKGGWHYVLIDGFYTLPDGSTVFLWANSWGTDWGNEGFAEGDEDWFNAGRDIVAWPVKAVV